MPVLIPMDNKNDAFDFNVALEEVVYRLSFRWNGRMENWVFDIFTDENVPIQTGNPFIVDLPFMFQNQNGTKPPGMLLAINTQDTGVNSDRFDIGGNVRLYYYTVDELAALPTA